MIAARFATPLATSRDAALTAFDEATFAIAAHRPGADVALRQALEADPDCVGAHALFGLVMALGARASTLQAARMYLHGARAALQRAKATKTEIAFVEALGRAVEMDFLAAARILEAELEVRPAQFLAAKLAHAFRFIGGDPGGLAIGIEYALAALPFDHPGHAFLLGCRAFAFGETGCYDDAELAGRAAVECQPYDAWGQHAVAHVFEMTARAEEGIDWIERFRPIWSGCNNFARHVSWHQALNLLEVGRQDEALAVYDAEIVAPEALDYRDFANAASFLFRLAPVRADLGPRWEILADMAEQRRNDTQLTFAALHELAALLAAGRASSALDLTATLVRAKTQTGEQGFVRRVVGAPLARAMLSLNAGGIAACDIARVLRHVPRLGGSAAQRDLFIQVLAGLAAQQGNQIALADILDVRQALKADDTFARRISKHVEPARDA